jgi:hypothetical protein
MTANTAVINAKTSKVLLYSLVFLLVFEGLLRKLSPGGLSTAIFFIKDFLCASGVLLVFNTRIAKSVRQFSTLWQKLTLAFIPLLVYTTFLDPVLGLFGAKEYLLYMVVALLVPIAFDKKKIEELKHFLFFCASLLVPTVITAIIQNNLPPTHWLNLSVGGESLDIFSAGGKLRVSSTFSFTGQFSFFLNAVSGFFASVLFLKPKSKFTIHRKIFTFGPYILGLLLIIGAFITGGRTAVLGVGGCLVTGFVTVAWRYPSWFALKGPIIIAISLISLGTLRMIKPEYFAAYDARSNGTAKETHTEEVEGRMFDQFTRWTNWFFNQDVGVQLLGQGLGVMTNGSAQISSYASKIRSNGFWTESDVDTTLWEGGGYLAILWYGMRIYVIWYCYKLWRAIRNRNTAKAVSFLFASVLITGVTGTLSIQPPLAIWWWLTIGVIIALRDQDVYERLSSKSAIYTQQTTDR